MKLWIVTAAAIAYLAMIQPSTALDQNLPPYKPVEGVSGELRSTGSDTLEKTMQLWARGFRERYPSVNVIVEGKGSATAPVALFNGTAQFGPMSRSMTTEEAKALEGKYGYKPSNIAVAVDALAVYVNKDNPIKCLSMEQVDRIFSARRKGSGGKSIDTWGDAGLTGEWAAKPISLYGRNQLSGTYEFFRDSALFGGEYKEDVKKQAGSEDVVQNVSNDKFAIGYSGIGYKTDGVRTVPLAVTFGRECFDTSAEATYSGNYPIARFLYIYFNRKPNEQLDPLRGQFLKYILSREGQSETEKSGFYPITNEVREKELKRLGLSAFAD